MPEKIRLKEIAVLGATSHIANNIIFHMSRGNSAGLDLFVRSKSKMKEFISRYRINNKNIRLHEYKSFRHGRYDAVINCVGLGDPARIKQAGAAIFEITETYDNMALDYLKKNPVCLYINFSSGAVYGKSFGRPVDENDSPAISINRIEPADYYALAKINSEAKHRAHKDLRIFDIRIFSFFSRFIDMDARFLLSEILRCTAGKKEFSTNSNNIVRDYIHPLDLISLLEKCMEASPMNMALDAYSARPAEKFEIIDFFRKEYGLTAVVNDQTAIVNATGSKDIYYSVNKKAESIGYRPAHTSMEAIRDEARELLKPDGLKTGGVL